MDLLNLLQENKIQLLFIAIFIIVVVVSIKSYVFYQSYKIKKRIHKGLIGEKKAFKFLEQNNYKVINAQVKMTHEFFINHEKVKVDITPDYLVKKNGKFYLVEVKTGESVGSMFNASTRRQVLEYSLINPYDGVLLVNMIEKTIDEIEFSFKSRKKNFIQKIFS